MEAIQTYPERVFLNFGTDLDAGSDTSRHKVLLVEDDPDSVILFKRMLIQAGYDVASAFNGLEGLKKLNVIRPDIILLDLMMPDMDGWEMLSSLRQDSNLPVIVITALNHENNVVRALKLGADDYITKPFNHAEVVERIRVILRRVTRLPENNVYFDKINLAVNLKNGEVRYHNQLLDLTNKEFAVLASLVRHAPTVVDYETLRMEVWGDNQPSFQNRIKFLVCSLRHKLAMINPQVEIITTIGRHGYRLKID
ncbi:MAG: response regulator transcription factor [Anaerolineae bacterium]|nr:response regulator transcription factor [Anaerolineae bacterium]